MIFDVPRKLEEEVQKLIEEGVYLNRSDFLREATRYYLMHILKIDTDVGWGVYDETGEPEHR